MYRQVQILGHLTHRRHSTAARRQRFGPLRRQATLMPGFTLMEVLIGLVVFSLLMMGLVQGLRLGINSWQAQSRTLAVRGDIEATDRTLRTLIEQMDPGGVSGRPAIFKGTSHSLVFTTTLPQAADMMVTRGAVVTLAVDERKQLQLLWLPNYRYRIGPVPPPGRVTLLNDVDHLELAYWRDSRAGWQPEWAAVVLPKLIRIRMVFTPESGRTGYDIVIMPMRDRWRL
jgi:prepilin-type N-terminal cleavage/methylation domain-containing protein